jgi:hypothetical protein
MQQFMKNKLILLLLTAVWPPAAIAQHVMGTVYETVQGQAIPLEGANVFIIGAAGSTGTGTTTDESGSFHLNKPENGPAQLVISFIGFVTDTVPAEGTAIEIYLKKAVELNEVEVKGSNADTYISSLTTAKTEVITIAELENNACCNLSESFESNATVDVSFSDAITGAKQIQMLGLAGKYSQLLTDLLPSIRGIGLPFGLNYIPGPWIEGINLNKGAGSVSNGFESITGQVDVELRKPEESDPFFLNLYGNSEARLEANLLAAQKLNDQWHHMLLLHGNTLQNKLDHNHDHFLDQPLNRSLSVMDRWKFNSGKRVESMFGAKYIYDDRWGGSVDFNPDADRLSSNEYGFGLTVNRGEAFVKTSFNFPEKPQQSLGIQLLGTYHDQNGYYGLREYDGEETNFYANLIFLSAFKETRHKYKTGLSYLYDRYSESFGSIIQSHTESVPGAFFEYTYDDLEQWSVVAGLRGDYFNGFGFEVLPRLHVRYKVTPLSTLRFSGGRGIRLAHPLTEGSAYFASSRQFVIANDLQPEDAWNIGLNFTQTFYAFSREGSFSLDVYRTDFTNQVIVDVDSDPQSVYLYNLNGTSYANSLQAEIAQELFLGFDARLAYKMYDVKQTFNETLREAPLTPAHRALLVLTYETPDDHWNFSFTTQWVGEQRLPVTSFNPPQYQMGETSPSFFRLLGQVTYAVKEWEFYLGSENINNFTQQNRIIAPHDPFGPYFDTSIVWGPVSDRMVYAGLRLTIPKK